MMLRDAQKSPDKVYYEPISTVKQIEKLITKIEIQNKDLKDKINTYTKINEENQNVINNLLKEINRVEKMSEILHNRMRDHYKQNQNEKLIKKENYNTFDGKDIKKEQKRETNKIYDFQNIINKNKILEKKFMKIKAKLDKQKDVIEDKNKNIKTDYSQGIGELVAHTNRLFFYRTNLYIKPKEVNLHMKAYKRMKKKLKNLKKVEPNKNNYISLENVVFNTVNGRINN